MKASELRASILQEAVSGRLVPQDPSDGTAEDLLKEIAKEREALVKSGKIKKEKPLPEITEDEVPFEIPKTWKWVRLASLCDITTGSLDANAQISGGKYPFFTCGVEIFKTDTFAFDCEAVLLGGNNASGDYKMHYFNGKFNAYQRVYVITSKGLLFLPYIYYVVSHYLPYFQKNSKGTTTKYLILSQITNLQIPLPPLGEQKRIVDKIEDMMQLIDAYREEKEKLSSINSKFPRNIRASILQEAVSGRLVPQDPSEGTAEELLKDIEKERDALIKAGKIKKEKLLTEITEDEIPFEIPKTWKWVRLKSIVYNHGQKVPTQRFSYIDIGSINNLENRLNESEKIIEAADAPSRARKIVVKGDIIYATVRPYLHNTCIIDREFVEEPIVSTGFAVLSCNTGIFNKYLITYLLSPDFDNYANSNENAKGMAYPAINDDKLYKALIPIPPLKEQKRIVAKIDELVKIIDKL